MTGHMNMFLPLGDHDHALVRELILDAADGDFIAGNLLGREQHVISTRQFDLVAVASNAAQCGSRLALPSSSDYHHLVCGAGPLLPQNRWLQESP